MLFISASLVDIPLTDTPLVDETVYTTVKYEYTGTGVGAYDGWMIPLCSGKNLCASTFLSLPGESRQISRVVMKTKEGRSRGKQSNNNQEIISDKRREEKIVRYGRRRKESERNEELFDIEMK